MMGSESIPASETARLQESSLSFLEKTLWIKLSEGADGAEKMFAWLSLLNNGIDGMSAGVVVLPEGGSLAPLAVWPVDATLPAPLTAAADEALERGRGTAHTRGAGAEAVTDIALPIVVEGEREGVVAIRIDSGDPAATREAFRALRWGAAWVREHLTREDLAEARRAHDHAATALRLFAVTLEEKRLRAAAMAFVTHLAERMDCDRVSLGFRRRGHTRVYAISETARFSKQMNLLRLLGAAMDEALDQRSAVVFPPPSDDPVAVLAHEELARLHRAAAILTMPLFDGERLIGAVLLERSAEGAAFSPEDRAAVDYVASAIAPVLSDKRANDRWLPRRLFDGACSLTRSLLGPRHLGAKLSALALVLVAAFFSVATTEYAVTADARIEGTVRRAIVAPFDGFISDAPARPGDRVAEGEALVALDDRDLVLERLAAVSEREQQEQLYREAMGERRRSDINVIQAKLDQVETRIEIIEDKLARAAIEAPFEGIVVAGDLSQRIGGTVQKGEELLEIAPLDSYRVILKVDERQLEEVHVGQPGSLLVASLPDRRFPFRVTRITPIAEPVDGGIAFTVEAELEEGSDRLRPGMHGVGKIAAGERLLIHVWTDPLTDWMRLFLWRWWP